MSQTRTPFIRSRMISSVSSGESPPEFWSPPGDEDCGAQAEKSVKMNAVQNVANTLTSCDLAIDLRLLTRITDLHSPYVKAGEKENHRRKEKKARDSDIRRRRFDKHR